MLNKALEKLSDHTGRRWFLGWAIKASAALAASLLGVETAYAFAPQSPPQACCSVCWSSGPKSDCTASSYACCWCWTCCDYTGNHKTWTCKECWTGSCPDSKCNFACAVGRFPDECYPCSAVACSKVECTGTTCT